MRRALLAAVAVLAACQGSDGYTRAREITSVDQTIGGPRATARVGDFLLENDKIRAVIEQAEQSTLPTDVGGTLIDIDLQRPERGLNGGHGLDQLGQVAPIANLDVAQAIGGPIVRITKSKRGAEVTVAAEGGPVFRILLALGILIDQTFVPAGLTMNMYTEYEVRPGEPMVRISTSVGFNVPFCPVTEADGCPAECDDALYDDDCECPAAAQRCQAAAATLAATPLPDRPGGGLLDILLGDLPRPVGTGACTVDTDCDQPAGERCVRVTRPLGGDFSVCRAPDARDAGVFFGDLLVLGGQMSPFVRGLGYDVETDIRRKFDLNEDTLSDPVDVDAILATGDRISLGYTSPEGRILVPIFRGPFSLGATHAVSCATDDPGCLDQKVVRFERLLSVGNGDVASAQAPLLAATGTATGTVRGVVRETPTGAPLSGVSVYALRDPRDLPCDAACQASCPIAGTPETWDLDALRAMDRCRTRSAQFPEGTSAVESFARTDPGTDPIADGDFEMELPAGDYVLVATEPTRAPSTLLPITVTAGDDRRVALELAESATLAYAIYDADGKLVPAKITIGDLPGAPCDTDDECATGELCQGGACDRPWGALLPLEMGGRRPVDGILYSEVSGDGEGEIDLPPGDYDVLISRGPHYSIDRRHITLAPRLTTPITASIRRVVDRHGWVAAELHTHAENSIDSGVSMRHRVDSFRAEDMDLIGSSDHDWITDYAPLIEDMGASDRLDSMIGVEVTTQEYGHYLAFPLKYAPFADGERLPANGAVQWRGRNPQNIIDTVRQLAPDGESVLIDIPHPYDYFDFYRIDPVTLEPSGSLLTVINSMLDPALFTGDFEAMELANTKNYGRIRRATVGETARYGAALDALIAQVQGGTIDQATFDRLWMQLTSESTRERLHRTVAEQDAALAGDGADVTCVCDGDRMCGAGLVCEPSTLTCVAAPGLPNPPPAADGLCRWSRGVLDDWFNMLDRGVFRTGVAGTDEHGPEDGFMRTLLETDGTTPPNLDDDSIAQAILAGKVIVTNGPMVHFTVDGAGLGSMVSASGAVELSIEVEKAPWYDVDRIEIYRNGHLLAWANGCDTGRGNDDADPDTLPCIAEGDAVVAWDQRITDHPDVDAWYSVVVYGLDGRTLSPVYESQVLAEINTPDITQRLFTVIPGLRDFLTPRTPSIFPVFPFAFTNPIWVDVGGDGWTPPETPPSWCEPHDFGCR